MTIYTHSTVCAVPECGDLRSGHAYCNRHRGLENAAADRLPQLFSQFRSERAHAGLTEDDTEGCPGHESLNGADMGQSVYCDGSCAGESYTDETEPWSTGFEH